MRRLTPPKKDGSEREHSSAASGNAVPLLSDCAAPVPAPGDGGDSLCTYMTYRRSVHSSGRPAIYPTQDVDHNLEEF